MIGGRSAQTPCFSYWVSTFPNMESCYAVKYERQGCEAGVQVPLLPDPRAGRALTESVYDLAAPLHELLLSEVVLECVDEPVAPDAVIYVSRVPAAASGYAVVQAGIHAGHKFDAGVIAAESLRFELDPQGRVLVSFESVLAGAVPQPMRAAVVARVCRWRRAGDAEAGTAAAPSILGALRAVSFPRPLSTSGAVLELFIREFCSARIASESIFRPLGSQDLLALRLALGVTVCARATKACSASRAALRPAVLTEPFRDTPGLCRFVSHVPILAHVEAGRECLWRWSETASLLERGGIC